MPSERSGLADWHVIRCPWRITDEEPQRVLDTVQEALGLWGSCVHVGRPERDLPLRPAGREPCSLRELGTALAV